MKRGLLMMCLMCCMALSAMAEFKDTNFNMYRYYVVHPQYYNTENTFYIAPLVYTVTEEGNVAVSGADLNATDIVIQDKVSFNGKSYAVTSIHGYAFYRCNKLETLTIPASVSYIYTSTVINKTVYASGPFLGCKNLKTINDNAMKAQGFWNIDARGRNFLKDISQNVTINTPAGSDYTAWAKYVNGLGLSVNISASGFGSYYIDKDLEIPTDDVSAVYFMKQEGSLVSYQALSDGYIPANTAVLIEGKANSTVTFRTTTIPEEVDIDVTQNILKGSLENKKAALDGEFYVLNKNVKEAEGSKATFEAIAAGETLQKNEAYLLESVASALSKRLAFEGISTGINSAKSDAENGNYYDLSGKQVQKTTKGITIQNRKKGLVK